MDIFKKFFGNGGVKNANAPPANSESNPMTVGKAPSEIHGKSKFDKAQEQTAKKGVYENAENKLRHFTYAERKNKTKENIIKVRNLYPTLSVFLSLSVGILTGDLFASGLSEIAYYLTLGILTIAIFLIAWLIEDLKKDNCKNYFSADNPSGGQRFTLNSLFIYSVAISGLGGYVASVQLNDNSAEIETSFQVQTDSVKTILQDQIALYDAIIAEKQEEMNLPKTPKNKWVRYHAINDLAEAQKQKQELLKEQKSSLGELKTEKAEELTADDVLNKYKAYVIVLVVFLLEFLYIRSYKYEYEVEKKIKAENRNHNFVKPPDEALPTNEPMTLEQYAIHRLMSEVMGKPLEQFNPVQNQTGTTPTASTNVGFQFKKDGSVHEPEKVSKKVTLNPEPFCMNPECKREHQKQRKDKLFCSTNCRKRFDDLKKEQGVQLFENHKTWFKMVLPNSNELEYWKSTRFKL